MCTLWAFSMAATQGTAVGTCTQFTGWPGLSVPQGEHGLVMCHLKPTTWKWYVLFLHLPGWWHSSVGCICHSGTCSELIGLNYSRSSRIINWMNKNWAQTYLALSVRQGHNVNKAVILAAILAGLEQSREPPCEWRLVLVCIKGTHVGGESHGKWVQKMHTCKIFVIWILSLGQPGKMEEVRVNPHNWLPPCSTLQSRIEMPLFIVFV